MSDRFAGATEDFVFDTDVDEPSRWDADLNYGLEPVEDGEEEKAFDPSQPRNPDGTWGSGGSAADSVASLVTFDNEVTSPDAVEKVREYSTHINAGLVGESSVKAIEVYDNPQDAQTRIAEMLPGVEVPDEARGVYDRETGKMVTSLWISEDSDESGRNFYHEFAHTLEGRITDADWEEPWTREWSGFDQDEGFAEAFSEYHVQKRQGGTADFAESKPLTHKLFTAWGW